MGSAKEWKLSHPLLRYVNAGTAQKRQFCFDDLTHSTFGRLVAYVGTEELKEATLDQTTEIAKQTLEDETLAEVTKLNQLLSESAEGWGDLYLQRLWRRPR
ncbi:hypothetical protein WYI_12488 [Ochrobactrum sp. CDB2]|nr:hypothetical protein WYI_12488 [Ochrobactrum sp. CDB2]